MKINMEQIVDGQVNFLQVFGKTLEDTVKQLTGQLLYLDITNSIAVTKAILFGLSDTACQLKEEDKTIALTIADLKGAPLLSLTVSHSDGTEDNSEGSWDIAYKFGPLDEDTVVYNLDNEKYQIGIIKRGRDAGFEFQDPSLIYTLLVSFANAINTYLDTVANPAERVETYLDGYFNIMVDVTDDKKIFNMIIEEPIIKAVVGKDTDEVKA